MSAFSLHGRDEQIDRRPPPPVGGGPDAEIVPALPTLPADLTPVQKAEALRIDQRERYRNGQLLPAAAYLARYSFLRENPDLAFEFVYREFMLREEAGETVAVEDYEHQYPSLAHLLRGQLAAHRTLHPKSRMTQIARRATPVASTSPQIALPSLPAASATAPGLPAATQLLLTKLGCGLLEEVGQSEKGVTYKVMHHRLSRFLALRLVSHKLFAHAEEEQRFVVQLRAFQQIQYPHLVQVIDVGNQDGSIYYLMEFVEGDNLSKLIAGRPQRPSWSARIAEAVAWGVHHAHSQGLFHGDLKPASVLVDRRHAIDGQRMQTSQADDPFDQGPVKPATPSSQKTGNPKLGDFGMAPRLDSVNHPRNLPNIRGTPSYMAPETVAGEPPGEAADVYGLGAILYEMLTGRPPFVGGNDRATLQMALDMELAPPSVLQAGVPPALEAICMRALEKRPGNRYSSPREFAEDLARFQDNKPVLAPPMRGEEPLRIWADRHPKAAAILLAALVALTLTAGFSSVIAITSTLRYYHAREVSDRAAAVQERAIQDVAAITARHARMLAERGDVARALPWLTRLPLPAAEDSSDEVRAARRDLAAWLAQAHELRQMLELPGPARAVQFAEDGRALVTIALGDGATVQTWNANTGLPVATTLRLGGVFAASALSSDGQFFLLAQQEPGRRDRTISLWDRASAKPVGKSVTFPGVVRGLAFKGDGKAFVVVGVSEATKRGEGRVWNTATIEPIGAPFSAATPINCATFSADGRTLVAGLAPGSGTAAIVVDAATGQPVGSPFALPGGVVDVAASPNGKWVALAGADGSVHVLESASLRPALSPLVHPGRAQRLAFSPDSRLLATGGGDGSIRLWDPMTGLQWPNPANHNGAITALAFDPTGSLLLSGSSDNAARLWRVVRPWSAAMGRPEGFPSGATVREAAWSADRKRGAWVDGDGGVWLVDRVFWKADNLAKSGYATQVALSQDGTRLAAGGQSTTIWDAVSRQPLFQPLVHRGPMASLSFSPDAKLLAIAEDRDVQVWDLAKSKLAYAPFKHKEPVLAVAWTMDGKRLAASAGVDRQKPAEIRLWDVATGLQIGDAMTAGGPVTSLQFSPDGRFLLSWSVDGVAGVWGGQRGLAISSVKTQAPGASIVLSAPGGEAFLTLNGGARLWETKANPPKNLETFGGPRDRRPTLAAFAADGRSLLMAYDDGSARLWDVASVQPLGPVILYSQPLVEIAFEAAGNRFLTLTQDGSLGVVELPALSPLEGADSDQLRVRAEVRTGLRLDESLNIVPLDAEVWRRSRQELTERDALRK